MKEHFFLNKKKRENVSIPTYLLLDTRDHWLWHGCPRRRKRKDAVGDRRERERRQLGGGSGVDRPLSLGRCIIPQRFGASKKKSPGSKTQEQREVRHTQEKCSRITCPFYLLSPTSRTLLKEKWCFWYTLSKQKIESKGLMTAPFSDLKKFEVNIFSLSSLNLKLKSI